MTKMTKKEALQKTAEMWKSVYKNKMKCKPLNDFRHGCPCCEYVLQNFWDDPDNPSQSRKPSMCQNDGNWDNSTRDDKILCIDHCPLKDLWPKGCEDLDAVYCKWEDSFNPKYAKKIYKFAKGELKESGSKVETIDHNNSKYKDIYIFETVEREVLLKVRNNLTIPSMGEVVTISDRVYKTVLVIHEPQKCRTTVILEEM
jgi:rhamnogalacturonyl hydrolase YesR